MPLSLNGYSVWITPKSNNRELDQWKVEKDDDNSISCYIPSVVDQEFSICWEDKSSNPTAIVACYMDGRPMGGVATYPKYKGRNQGVFTSAKTFKPFKFSPVQLTDDDDLADPDGVNPDLGCIQIEIHRVRRELTSDDRRERRGDVMDVGPVHERSKKLGGECVSLGTEQQLDNQTTRQFVAPSYIDNGPFAVFRFMYRSKEFLQAKGIIPPLAANRPERKSTSRKGKQAAHSDLHARRLTRRERKTLKRELDQDELEVKPSIKREPSSGPSVSVPAAGPSRDVIKKETQDPQ